MRLDHVIVAVANLEQAMADYRSLGFSVFFGGQHAGGVTHNALICLADGSYIELIAPVDPQGPPAASPYLGKGRGFAGFALLADDLQAAAAHLVEIGLEFDGPNPGGRLTADGEELRWESLFFPRSIAPFLIADVTSRHLRVPRDPARLTHANGAVGIAAMSVTTGDFEQTMAQYRAILGAPKPLGNGAMEQEFRLEGCTVYLAPAPPGSHMADAGPTPKHCVLETAHVAAIGPLDRQISHGASFSLARTR
jgi:hypothetical protein